MKKTFLWMDRPTEKGETSVRKLDNTMLTVVVHEVMKAMGEKQSFSNFTGKILASKCYSEF